MLSAWAAGEGWRNMFGDATAQLKPQIFGDELEAAGKHASSSGQKKAHRAAVELTLSTFKGGSEKL